MPAKSLKKNFVFNLAYQILIVIAPLIVTPYVSRVLGVDGVGECSYANSIVSYFLLFAVLGTGIYGQRAIGYVQNNKEERSRVFWEIFIFRVITSMVALAAYAVFLFAFSRSVSFVIFAILALNIPNVIIDVSWFMQGMEEFGKTATTSIVFRIFYIASVFLFIKQPSDLWKYVLISVGFGVLCNLCVWMFVPKYLCRVKGVNPFRDIKGIILLFLPTIATQIYLVLDKSMIGWFSNGYTENGYYEQADKIVKMSLTVITALGIVMIPRIAKNYKEGNHEQIKYYLYKSYRYVWMMSIPIMFGFATVSNMFVRYFFGVGYEKCAVLIPILSCLTVFIGMSNVTGIQYFVPTEKQNVLTMTVVVGAIVNVILNLCLIPFFASLGAAIATIVAEFCVTLAGFIYIKKKKLFALRPILTCSWKYWIAGIVMCASVFGIKLLLPVTIWALIVLTLIGIIVYFVVLLLLRDKMILEFLSGGISALKSRLKKSATKNGADDIPAA